MQIMPRDFILPFVKKEQVAKDTWTFYFDRSVDPEIDFIPGQFIKMFLDVSQPDERGSSRTFSISSSPLNKQYLTVTTRIIQSAFKKTLSTLTTGTPVKFFGPSGRFTLNEEEIGPRVFLAGGIGITPFHSIVTYAAAKNLPLPITLFVSFSTVEEMIFYDELMQITKTHPNIRVVYTITQPEVSKEVWAGETGRISKDFIKKYLSDFSQSLFLVSGPPAMVDAMVQIVLELGIPEERIRKEKFVGY